jgi:methylenetetrahydrofolate dehydrogenase (NADP+)/methenyltetrahydrofolate cyclohydrolase
MTARIIDGKAIAHQFRSELAVRVDRLKAGGVKPGLAVVIVGDDPASKVYVRNKAAACEQIGMHSEVHALSAGTAQGQIIGFLRQLNENPAIHGILVQLPLPNRMDSRAVIEAIAPEKDVDGFHWRNVGALVVGDAAFYPCHAVGRHEDAGGGGRRGRRQARRGGRPLEHRGQAHGVAAARRERHRHGMPFEDTGPGRDHAAGRHPGRGRGKGAHDQGGHGETRAVVIDVASIALPTASSRATWTTRPVAEVASRSRPVPGGVGPMTIAMLLANTVKSGGARGRLGARGETRIA